MKNKNSLASKCRSKINIYWWTITIIAILLCTVAFPLEIPIFINLAYSICFTLLANWLSNLKIKLFKSTLRQTMMFNGYWYRYDSFKLKVFDYYFDFSNEDTLIKKYYGGNSKNREIGIIDSNNPSIPNNRYEK